MGFENESLEMSATCEAYQHMRTIIGPLPPGVPLKTVMPGIARRLKISERRGWAIWRREARSILADEMDRLRGEAQRKRGAEENYAIELELRADRLMAIDPEMFGDDAGFLRHAADRLRALAG